MIPAVTDCSVIDIMKTTYNHAIATMYIVVSGFTD